MARRLYRSIRLRPQPEAKIGPDASASQTATLNEILLVLQRAHPVPKTTILSTIVDWVQKVAKYVGLPALLIGAVLPAYNLIASAIEYRNTRYIKSVYIDYATELSGRHLFDRALGVLSQLDKLSALDARAQYTSAKISEEAAYYQGKSYDQVEDTVRILLALNNNKPWTFPNLGGDSEILELEQRLIDIYLKRSMFKDALAMVQTVRKEHTNLPPNADARLLIQEGRAHIYAFDKFDTRTLLAKALQLAKKCGCRNYTAEAEHALGTAAMFSGDPQSAAQHFDTALHIFETLDDHDGELRTWTNIAIIRGDELDWQGALAARRQQERLAREDGDQQAIGNALIGLAVAERNLDNAGAALTFALEAEAIFTRLGVPVGIGSALTNEANIYVRQQDYAKALDAANRALPYFVGERDLRGVGATLGIIAQAADEVGDKEAELYGLGGSIGLEQLTNANGFAGQRDMAIHLSMLDQIRVRDPDGFEVAKAAALPRLRELERSLRTPQLKTGLE